MRHAAAALLLASCVDLQPSADVGGDSGDCGCHGSPWGLCCPLDGHPYVRHCVDVRSNATCGSCAVVCSSGTVCSPVDTLGGYQCREARP